MIEASPIGPRSYGLSAALASGDVSFIDGFFAENAVDHPIVQWCPEPERLDYDPMQYLMELWLQLNETHGLPPASNIDPSQLRPALGRLLILEPVENYSDFRYRLYGTVLSTRMGRDFTGTLVSEFEASYISDFYLATYRAVCRRREALYTCHFPSERSYARKIQRLILPYGAGGDVTRILCCIESEPRDPVLKRKYASL